MSTAVIILLMSKEQLPGTYAEPTMIVEPRRKHLFGSSGGSANQWVAHV